ncbi:MAG TPA: NADH-quinone oxidoreductase subunit I [Pseudomonadota bacterium]|nr:NADH-quinone oxidoreductase subunit I [Pseudomonadota bacterium]
MSHAHAPSQSDHTPSSASKKARVGVRVVGRPDSLEQRIYLPEVIRGLGVTAKHFFANLFSRKYTVTVEYPEQKLRYADRHRGLHRLMHREDGQVRCVACMLCPTACPAHCITIVAEDTGNKNEKRPRSFEIDELRCIVCGLCVEACPCDALRMDSGVHAPAVDFRGDAIQAKIDLLKRGSQSVATQGGIGADWRTQQPTVKQYDPPK